MEVSTILAMGGVAGAPIVLALVNGIVKPFTENARWYVLSSLVLGIAWSLGVQAAVWEAGGLDRILFGTAVIYGVLSGLTAAGLYSVVEAEQRRGNRRT